MRRCIAYGGSTPLLQTLDTVAAADAAGLDGIWSAEHVGLQDAMVPSVVYALRTTRMEIGLVGLNADTRSPGLLAMELSTLATLAPGRVRVQVGTGSLPRARWIGVTEPRTVRGVETFVAALRDLLAGRTVTASSEAFQLDGLRLDVAPIAPIQVDVMAIRPKMLELAARVGDGVSLSAGASREYLRITIETVKRAVEQHDRDLSNFRVSAVVPTAIADDLATARRQLAAAGLLRFRMPELQVGVDMPDPAVVSDVLERQGIDAAVDLFSDEVIDQFGIVATPDDVAAKLAEYAALGLDELVVMLSGDTSDHVRIAQLLAEHE
jgi:5,10-methylenetetrahydromethanopterin reductase